MPKNFCLIVIFRNVTRAEPVSGDGGIAGAKDMRVEVVAVGTVGN